MIMIPKTTNSNFSGLHTFDFTVKVAMPADTRKAIADYLEFTDYIDDIGLCLLIVLIL